MEERALTVFPGVNCQEPTNKGNLWLQVCIWETKDYYNMLPVSRTAVNINRVSLITILIRSYTPVAFYSFTKCYNMNISCDPQWSLFCKPKNLRLRKD